MEKEFHLNRGRNYKGVSLNALAGADIVMTNKFTGALSATEKLVTADRSGHTEKAHASHGMSTKKRSEPVSQQDRTGSLASKSVSRAQHFAMPQRQSSSVKNMETAFKITDEGPARRRSKFSRSYSSKQASPPYTTHLQQIFVYPSSKLI